MKEIPGYPNYRVHEDGFIWSVPGMHKLQPQLNIKGYHRVQLYNDEGRKWYFVHRLVASAFHQNRGNKPEVNHMDWNIWNNCAKNLEWVTSKENKAHARKRRWPECKKGPDCPF